MLEYEALTPLFQFLQVPKNNKKHWSDYGGFDDKWWFCWKTKFPRSSYASRLMVSMYSGALKVVL
jgi:hypothetical protein